MRALNIAACLGAMAIAASGPAHRASAADISRIHGYWQGEHTPCGQITDDSIFIDSRGASHFESSCTIRNARRSGDTYTLEQTCEYFENEREDTTLVIRRLSGSRIEVEGTRYRKCRNP